MCKCTSLQVKLEDAEQKKTVAEGIAETVSREKAVVEVETSKAQVQAEQVAKTQAEVGKFTATYPSANGAVLRTVNSLGTTVR